MSWFKREPTRTQLLDEVAEGLVMTSIKSPVPEWLSEEAEQPLEHVQAEWIALNRWSLDYTIQKTLQSYDKVRPLWEAVEKKTRAYLVTQPCYQHFRDVVDARSKDYGEWFNFGLSQCKSAEPFLTFAAFVATRILKPEQDLKVGLNSFEQEMGGASMYINIATLAGLSSYITNTMKATAEFLKRTETNVPRVFTGTMQ